MNDLNQMPIRSSNPCDDLQQLKSIGQSIIQYLRSLGDGVVELADFMPDASADCLKATDPQAQSTGFDPAGDDNQPGLAELSGSGRNSHPPHSDPTGAFERPNPEIIAPNKGRQTTQQSWRELADFFVSFGFTVDQQGQQRLCTRVHHSQDDISAQWPGLAIHSLLKWTLDQVNLSIFTESEVRHQTRASLNRSGQLIPPSSNHPTSQLLTRPGSHLLTRPSSQPPKLPTSQPPNPLTNNFFFMLLQVLARQMPPGRP